MLKLDGDGINDLLTEGLMLDVELSWKLFGGWPTKERLDDGETVGGTGKNIVPTPISGLPDGSSMPEGSGVTSISGVIDGSGVTSPRVPASPNRGS